MEQNERYIPLSLELHLFFARIMKEHSLFLKAGFTMANQAFSARADFFRQEFERLLEKVVFLSNGAVSQSVLNSNEIVTEFTAEAENQTMRFTNIPINKMLTQKELNLKSGQNTNRELARSVSGLNQMAINLLNGLINLKEQILNNVLSCKMFTMNYPHLIEHILREAKLYRSLCMGLENGDIENVQTMKETEMFWNEIMMEHALFIRGLLDPSENTLISTSNSFAKSYEMLLKEANDMNNLAMLKNESLNQTIKFKEFKAAGVKGIEDCKIRSIILPLLADHVLREANHYIRLLSE